MKLLGIDPSLTGTGIATDDEVLTLRMTSKQGDDRLRKIHAAVRLYASGYDFAVIEDLPTHAKGAGKTGLAHGVVRLALIQTGVPYIVVTPATLKKFATGNGAADKTRMAMEAFKRAEIEFRDDNECDAWWAKKLAEQHFGCLPFELPKTHLVALDKIEDKWEAVA